MKTISDSIELSKELNGLKQRLSEIDFADKKFLVAVSGWPDSMLSSVVLYQFFLEKKLDFWNLFFVHCNHKTRKETDDEEKFIRLFFAGFNLDICTYAGIDKSENSLREWRYMEFNEIIKKNQIDYLVTWHNLTDRIESTFMNMCRWSWLNGFLSMKYLDENNLIDLAKIVRPLLGLSKNNIERICSDLQIPYVTDNSNFDQNTSFRNKIRLSILPQLAEISNKNDDFSCTFFDSMKQIYDDIESKSWQLDVWNFIEIKKSPYWNADFAFLWDIPFGFIDENVLLYVFRKFNVYLDVTKKTLDDFLQFFHKAEQWYKYINWAYFFISNGRIYIIKAKQNFWEKCIEKEIIIDKVWDISVWKNIVNIDSQEFVWMVLRYPKIWDKMWSKSWWKYCINKKIPVFWRNFIPVIVDGNQVLQYFDVGFCA